MAMGWFSHPMANENSENTHHTINTIDTNKTRFRFWCVWNLNQHHKILNRQFIIELNKILVRGQSVAKFTHNFASE